MVRELRFTEPRKYAIKADIELCPKESAGLHSEHEQRTINTASLYKRISVGKRQPQNIVGHHWSQKREQHDQESVSKFVVLSESHWDSEEDRDVLIEKERTTYRQQPRGVLLTCWRKFTSQSFGNNQQARRVATGNDPDCPSWMKMHRHQMNRCWTMYIPAKNSKFSMFKKLSALPQHERERRECLKEFGLLRLRMQKHITKQMQFAIETTLFDSLTASPSKNQENILWKVEQEYQYAY